MSDQEKDDLLRHSVRELNLLRKLCDEQELEIDRLKSGQLTKEEIHNLCHNLHGTVDVTGFAEG